MMMIVSLQGKKYHTLGELNVTLVLKCSSKQDMYLLRDQFLINISTHMICVCIVRMCLCMYAHFCIHVCGNFVGVFLYFSESFLCFSSTVRWHIRWT